MLCPQVTVLDGRQEGVTGNGAGASGHRGGTEGDQVINIPPEGITGEGRNGGIWIRFQHVPEAVSGVEDWKSWFGC